MMCQRQEKRYENLEKRFDRQLKELGEEMKANTNEAKEGLGAVHSKMERQVGWNHVVCGYSYLPGNQIQQVDGGQRSISRGS